MKIRASIIWFVVVAMVLIAVALWLEKKKSVETPPKISMESDVASPATVRQGLSAGVQVRSNAPPVAQTIPNAPLPPPSKEQQMREGLAELNNENIVFYGKVLDQFGVPVTNAKVAGSIQVNNGTRVGVDRFSLVTDENGSFTVNGYKGENLGIWITKNGYVMATTNTLFTYSYLWPESRRTHPDPNNPTVINMWKLQGAELLASVNQDYKLRYTGAPLNFDLVAGKIVPAGGDMKITVNRPTGIVSEHNPQDWSMQVEAVDGGLIETTVANARATYAAPQDGYEPNAMFEMSTATQSWHAAVDQMFFIESQNGKNFSKVRLILGINDTPDGFMDITLKGVANTNSSRNWEATVPK